MAESSASIEIEAPPEVVFDQLVTEGGMTAWMGQHARLDARVGGRLEVDIAGWDIRGHHLEVDRPHRVVVSRGAVGGDDLPPGFSTVVFELVRTGAGTRAEATHSGLPEARTERDADGWGHFLPRLARAAHGQIVGSDAWIPSRKREAF